MFVPTKLKTSKPSLESMAFHVTDPLSIWQQSHRNIQGHLLGLNFKIR